MRTARRRGVQALRRVEIKLGDLCNNRCAFCVSGGRRDEHEPWAPLSRVKEELEHYRREGCSSVGLLGGEPTAYPGIIEALRAAKALGYERIALCTNGTRLSDAAFCARLVEAGLTRVTVSLHSHRPELEDALLTKVPGNHARKVAGLRHMVSWREKGRMRDGISLNPVLCRPNLADMEDYLRFVRGLGIDDVRFNYIWPEHEALGSSEWVPSYREAAPFIVKALLLGTRRLRMRVSFGGVPRCVLRWGGTSARLADALAARHLDETLLDPENDVSIPGEHGGRGDRFVWQQRKKDDLKTYGPRCGECRLVGRCEGVWKTYAQIHGLDELRPL